MRLSRLALFVGFNRLGWARSNLIAMLKCTTRQRRSRRALASIHLGPISKPWFRDVKSTANLAQTNVGDPVLLRKYLRWGCPDFLIQPLSGNDYWFGHRVRTYV